jgi:hypothetical protein
MILPTEPIIVLETTYVTTVLPKAYPCGTPLNATPSVWVGIASMSGLRIDCLN